MRLRNRMVNAEFYTDPELLRWPSAKRDLYRSLWALAEDSACVEDDPFGWKCAAWASPVDAKTHTVAKFTEWRQELIDAKKAFPYEAAGGRFLFLPDMAEHEHPRNPQSPNLPLPEWVTWNQHASDLRKGAYTFDWALYKRCTTVETTNLTVPALPCPVLSSPDIEPVSSRSSQVSRKERGSSPQVDDQGAASARAYWETKLGRDLTPDEISTVKRWVRTFGAGEVKVQIGYAAQDGFVDEPKRIYGALRASKARADGATS